VGREPGGEAAGRLGAVAVVDAGLDDAALEAQALCKFAALAPFTRGQAAGSTGEPGVQHHALAHPTLAHTRAQRLDHADDLVAQHLRKRDQRRHRVVEGAVHEDLLVVAAAQTAQVRPDHDPIRRRRNRFGNLLQLDRSQGPTKARGVNADRSFVSTRRDARFS
jgi:hypothetical protein